MHGLYGGIGGKKMLEFWYSKDFAESDFSCFKNVDRVNKRMKAMRPPHFVRRRLRPLDQLALYKTSEFKNWILYYCIPIMYDLFDERCMVHFFKLWKATFLLNGEEISLVDISEAKTLLQEYVEEFKTIYGAHYMTSNVHSLIHLADSALQMGPLFHTSCFCTGLF
jgi:hypothetical protein